jgi:pyruvate kinase
MLDSMQRNLRPTRAEVTDVANAIFDGTDAVMLSGETAVGEYPIEAVKMMDKIIRRAESSLNYENILKEKNPKETYSITDAICHAVSEIALDLKAKAIITSTTSGYTALMVSFYKPCAEIIAVTPSEKVLRRLSLFWGVRPLLVRHFKNTDEMMKEAILGAIKSKLVKKGDIVIITAGVPVGEKGKTNLIKVHKIE